MQSLIDGVRQLEKITVGYGLKIRKGPSGINIDFDESLLTTADTSFWAKITGRTSLGSNRWSYTFANVTKGGSVGYGGTWTNGSTAGTAYNSIEQINNGAGIEGNGVDVDGTDFPSGFSIQPVPTNSIVRIFETANGGTTEYWFSYENGIDGTC